MLGLPDWSFCIGLHTHPSNKREPFTETRTGLDHVCFSVADRGELGAWAARFAELGVEQSPIADAGSYSVLVFRDPDDIQLELIAFA